MAKHQEVNQQLIADKLKLSVSTVSRCFTNHPGINPETRARVFHLASQLGYQYLDSRTKPSHKRHHDLTVGVLICSDKEDPEKEASCKTIIAGISDYAQVHGHLLKLQIVNPGDAETAARSQNPTALIDTSGWDGALLIGSFPTACLTQLNRRVPCVSLAERYTEPDLDCVDVDHYRGISTLIDELVDQGHREFGFVSRTHCPGNSRTTRRYGALQEKLITLGIDFNPANCFHHSSGDHGASRESLETIVGRIKSGLSGIVCCCDHDAFDLMQELKEVGIDVPGDVSITGFGALGAINGLPAPSSMSIPRWEIGRVGMDRLVQRIRRPDMPTAHILLASKFEHGETIAPPAANSGALS